MRTCARASVAQGMGSAFSGKAYFLGQDVYLFIYVFFLIKIFELPKVNIKSKRSG